MKETQSTNGVIKRRGKTTQSLDGRNGIPTSGVSHLRGEDQPGDLPDVRRSGLPTVQSGDTAQSTQALPTVIEKLDDQKSRVITLQEKIDLLNAFNKLFTLELGSKASKNPSISAYITQLFRGWLEEMVQNLFYPEKSQDHFSEEEIRILKTLITSTQERLKSPKPQAQSQAKPLNPPQPVSKLSEGLDVKAYRSANEDLLRQLAKLDQMYEP